MRETNSNLSKFKEKIKNGLVVLILTSILGGWIYFFKRSGDRFDNILKYPSWTIGKVIETRPYGRPTGLSIRYEYSVDGRIYRETSTFPTFKSSQGGLFYNKTLPVVYSYKNPECSMLRITRRNFKEVDTNFLIVWIGMISAKVNIKYFLIC